MSKRDDRERARAQQLLAEERIRVEQERIVNERMKPVLDELDRLGIPYVTPPSGIAAVFIPDPFDNWKKLTDLTRRYVPTPQD